MSYNVRCYKNTGFNAVNIPDTPNLLNQCAYIDCDKLDIRQERFLSIVNIRANWEQIKDVDYVSIGDWFYFVDGVNMLSGDVASLNLSPDFITSTGGFTTTPTFTILDGVTNRVIAKTDAFGEFCEDDPYLAPALPLKVDMQWVNFGKENHTLVETTIDLANTALTAKGKTYSDDDGNKITTPTASFIGDTDNPQCHSFGTKYTIGELTTDTNPQTQVYNLNDDAKVNSNSSTGNRKVYDAGETYRAGMIQSRLLGIDGGIINHYQIPKSFVRLNYKVGTPIGVLELTPIHNNKIYTDHPIDSIDGLYGRADTDFTFEYGGNNYHNRLYYSNFTKYGIMSASNEGCEFNPADIAKDSPNSWLTKPGVCWVADPRPDGRPYYSFSHVNGQAVMDYNTYNNPPSIFFFRNCVSGLQWKKVPLVFTQVSGSALNTMKYQNSRNITDVNYGYQKEQTLQNIGQTTFNGVGGVVSELLAPVKGYGGVFDNAMGSMTALQNMVYDVNTANRSYEQLLANYQAVKNSELSELLVKNSVEVPTINFPYNSEIVRDFFGNGCLVYRFRYATEDLDRIDKILSMYGYKVTKNLEYTDFTNREKFNYVSCASVTVSGKSRWWNDGISAQLKNGVRVWHVLPNTQHYNGKASNPLKG